MTTAAAPDLQQKLMPLRRALSGGRLEEASALAARFLIEGMPLRPLARTFERVGKLEVLVDAVWADRDTTLARLSSIVELLHLCDEAGLAPRADDLARRLARASAPVTVSPKDYLHRAASDGRLLALFEIKYRGWNDDPALGLAARVEALAARCETPAALVDEVARHLAPQADPRWQREMPIDQAYGHAFRDANVAGALLKRLGTDPDPFLRAFYDSLTHGLVDALADMDESRRRFAALDLSRGLVLATAHNLFSRIEVTLADRMMPDSYAIHLRDLADADGHRNAAFRALKAVTDKKAVVIAPDGQQGAPNASAEIEVLGRRVSVSVGAALIAYESRGATAFYRTIRVGRRFVPSFTAGPERADGEGFDAFRTRWLAFYAAARETALRESPGDLAFFLRNQRP